MQTFFLQVGMSYSMRVFSRSTNRPKHNPHLHYKVFCPLLTLTYHFCPTFTRSTFFSYSTRHNAPEPPSLTHNKLSMSDCFRMTIAILVIIKLYAIIVCNIVGYCTQLYVINLIIIEYHYLIIL